MATTLERTDEASGEVRRSHRIISGAVAIGLVLVSVALPVWRAHLIAPQYPDGLHIYAYGHGMEGDIEEVDSLNHYVGMRPFNTDDVPEMVLYPVGIAVALAAVVVSTLARRRWMIVAARVSLVALPVIILADIQLRLYQYGHDLDPMAALRIPEFTPWVVGPTKVWNFTNVGYPGRGLIAIFAAALVVTFGPRLIARITRELAARTSSATATILLVVLFAAPPVHASDDGGPDHGGHDHSSPTTTAPGGAHPDRPTGERPSTVDHAGGGPLHELIAAAEPNETIVVPEGRYSGNVVIDVPVHLIGEGRPTIQGSGVGSTLVIRAPGTTVSGFRVMDSGPGPVGSPAGVRIEADDVHIEDVVVDEAYTGISVVGASRVRLVDNIVTGRSDAAIVDEGHAIADADSMTEEPDARGPSRLRGDGISLWDVDGVLVRGNTIRDARDGVYISFGTWVLIDTNQILDSRYGIHTMYSSDLTAVENDIERNLAGLVLMYGGPALALRNDILDNRSPSTGFGIILKDVVAAEAVENVIARNRVGLHLEGPSLGETEVRVHRNTIATNEIGATLPPSARATFSTNSFVDNLIQVGAEGIGAGSHVSWTEHGWGNFWSNYQGQESALPGRGSTPHREGSRIDGVIERAPLLISLASSPGMRLVRSVEAQRFSADPVAIDELPLVKPVSPALINGERVRSTAVPLTGLALVLASSLVMVWLRLPRRSPLRRALA